MSSTSHKLVLVSSSNAPVRLAGSLVAVCLALLSCPAASAPAASPPAASASAAPVDAGDASTGSTDPVPDAQVDAPGAHGEASADDRASPWTYSAEVGVPKLAGSEFKLVGAGALGYHGESKGVAAQLAFASYATQSSQAVASTSRNSFGLQGWWQLSDAKEPTRVELRGELGYASYGTVYIPISDTAGELLTEFSGMSRLSALIGGTRDVDGQLSVNALVGLGVQSESYSTSSGTGIDASTSTSARGLGRIGARYRIAPDQVTLRLNADLSYASVTRTQFAVDTEDLGAVLEPETFRLIESNNRLFGDLELLSFAGVVPNAFLGLDVLAINGDAGSSSTVVPLVGVGLSNW